MAPFLRLLRKDLEASRWPLGIFSGVIVGLLLFVRLRLERISLPDPSLLLIILAVPLIFLPFWLLWQSFQTLRTEWREDTIYTLLVLPVRGWQITLAKLVGICIEYSVLLVVYLGSLFLFYNQVLVELLQTTPGLWWTLRNGFLLYLVSLGILAAVIIRVHLAFVVSKMVGRLQGLVALWTLVLASWLVAKMNFFLEPVFRWLPALPVHKLMDLGKFGREVVIELDVGAHLGTLFGLLGLFFLTGYLLEHYVEISE